jgi:hypothetical protein
MGWFRHWRWGRHHNQAAGNERPEWPPPRDDPDREPSHQGAHPDHHVGWWEKWKRGAHP